MRTELRVLRAKHNVTQQEVAKRTGVSVTTFNLIENGTRRGSHEFWVRLQREFNLNDGEVWRLQNNI